MLSQKLTLPTIAEEKDRTGNIFLDTYLLDFLNLIEIVSEHDLQNFVLEVGKGFTFIGEFKP